MGAEMKVLFLLPVMLLLGCQTAQKVPEITTNVKTVVVTKMVPVPCIEEDEIPSEYVSQMPEPSTDVAKKSAGASLDVRKLMERDKKMRALLIKCTTLPEEPK